VFEGGENNMREHMRDSLNESKQHTLLGNPCWRGGREIKTVPKKDSRKKKQNRNKNEQNKQLNDNNSNK
jgi:hypothetical protein